MKRLFRFVFAPLFAIIIVGILFMRTLTDLSMTGEAKAIRLMLKGGSTLTLDNVSRSVSISDASKVYLREHGALFTGSNYNAHVVARTFRFKEFETKGPANIALSWEPNQTKMSLANAVVHGTIVADHMTRGIVRDLSTDRVFHDNQFKAFETVTFTAEKSKIDKVLGLHFHPADTLILTDVENVQIDFVQNIPGIGYKNSLKYLDVQGGKNYREENTIEVDFARVRRLAVLHKKSELHFTLDGETDNLTINGRKVNPTIYEQYIESSPVAHFITFLAWLIPSVLSIILAKPH